MTNHADVFAALAAPFRPAEVKQLPKGGRKLDYVTARSVMNRLDSVLGAENWWDEYAPMEHSVLCKLTIRLPDGREVTKCDAGGYAGMSDQGDDDKSGFSDAFKRAAVKFGVGRYLYKDGVPDYRDNAGGGPAATAPAKAAGDAPTWNDLVDKAIRYWHKRDPIRDGKERVAREHRIGNAICSAAIEEGLIAEATVLRPSEANGEPVRDAAKAWEAVKALYGRHPEWVRGFLRDYLRAKAEAAAVRGEAVA